MKKIIIGLSAAGLLLTSCGRDITSLNDDPKNPAEVNTEVMFTSASVGLVSQMTTPSVNFNNFRFFTQQWTETQYIDESVYNLLKRNVPDNNWTRMYSQMTKLELARTAVNALPDASLKASRTAAIEALEIYIFSTLVDTYGNIPYSQALQVDKYPTPVYDDAKVIYTDLIKRADAALALVESNSSSGFGSNDPIFGGNNDKIKLFLNTLKLRMGLNLADTNNALAKTTVESAYSKGVVLTNAQNLGLKFSSSGQFTSPVYQEMVTSGRNDFIPANTFVDALNASSDPRRPKYFTLKNGAYVGGLYGKQNVFADFSHVQDSFLVADSMAYLFDAAETNFMLAEAAERGFNVGGTAATYFTAGMKASLDFWGVDAVDQAAYLAANNYATLPGTWKQKIGNQAWIAAYNRGFEAWEFSRRLDFRTFVKPGSRAVPVRMPYPVNEGSVNNQNRTQAVVAQWGAANTDTQSSKVFWDIN
ncbi:SusD/RagB family nutrient-binding outer membrane lipoprotein [Chryseobacterium contaminans]|uniref:SusD/RagB family nutrient-binding outer membrane lipoprotein n=1 Tax=Chryseobacterium contaminans TaxID=1423959 RepID=UPI003015FD3B